MYYLCCAKILGFNIDEKGKKYFISAFVMPSSCCPSKLDKSRRMFFTKKGMGLLEEANQPRVLQLGMNIKVFGEDHKRGFYFHIFGQIFGSWLKRLSNKCLSSILLKVSIPSIFGEERMESVD